MSVSAPSLAIANQAGTVLSAAPVIANPRGKVGNLRLGQYGATVVAAAAATTFTVTVTVTTISSLAFVPFLL